MSTEQITIADFCSHPADKMLAVEHGDSVVELMRDGKIVDYISPAQNMAGSAGTLADWTGTGAGTVAFAPGVDPDEPAFTPQEWEDFPPRTG